MIAEHAAPWALVVDDEPELRTLIEFALTSQGFVVECAARADEAWEKLQARPYDIVVLDVVMPGMSGVDLCRRVRETFDIPVILLTALGETEHRVAGLEAGADDYVAKPFDPRELALRALAIHRRASHKDPQQVVVNGPLRLDATARTTRYHGRDVRLSESEFRLCLALAERAGRPMTHDELIAIVWGSGDLPGGREMLKTSIWRLRLRLTQVNPVTVIESVRGTGYMMVKLSG